MACPTAGSGASVGIKRNWITPGFLRSAINEIQVKFVVSQCKRVQHSRIAFWPRPFSEGLLGRKAKVGWDG